MAQSNCRLTHVNKQIAEMNTFSALGDKHSNTETAFLPISAAAAAADLIL